MSSELQKAVQRESMKPEYPYMPREEWDARVSRARSEMASSGIDALMILSSQNRVYFFGSTKTYRNFFPSVGFVPVKGPMTMINESADALVLDAEGYADWNIGYRGDPQAPTATAPDPVRVIIEVMDELGLDGKTVGMEFGQGMWWDGISINEWEAVRRAFPNTKFVDATSLIWKLRVIKSGWEVGVIRHLHKVTAKGYMEILAKVGPGQNERELFYEALRKWIDAGIVDSTNYTLNCINAIQPYRDRTLKDGDWIMLDGGPTYKGYCADMQRFIRIGAPGPEFSKFSRLACEGMWAAEAILKPGVTAGELWTAAYSAMADKDPNMWRRARTKRMVGWVGHGEGLNIHEPPYIVEGSREVIQEGMIFALEVPSYFENTFANMPEDTYLITANGYEKLSSDLGPLDTFIRT